MIALMSGDIGLFLGTKRGFVVLKALVNKGYSIAFVLILNQSDHELNNYTHKIEAFCKKNKIEHDFSKYIKPSDYKNFIVQHKPDVLLLIWWRYLLPDDCLNISKRKTLLLHDTLLPKYRGMATSTWPIINGEKETGLTLLYADKKMDAGDIVDQIKIPITNRDTMETMNKKYLRKIPKMILKNIDSILDGTNKRYSQDHKKATYGCKRVPEDGHINFHNSVEKIDRFIRAVSYPHPGAFCYYKGEKIILWKASIVRNPPNYVGRIPGRIITVSKKGYVDVLADEGILRIKEIAYANNPRNIFVASEVLKSVAVSLA